MKLKDKESLVHTDPNKLFWKYKFLKSSFLPLLEANHHWYVRSFFMWVLTRLMSSPVNLRKKWPNLAKNIVRLIYAFFDTLIYVVDEKKSPGPNSPYKFDF